jgi:hypothetical protein
MECKFIVGQRVVCVDAEPRYRGATGLTKGAVYTIAKITHPIWRQPGVLLEEVLCRVRSGWWHDRFRPVNESRLDIFRKMLKDTPVKEDA